MRVIAVRKQPEKGSAEGVEQVFPATELDNLIPQADYVLLAAPRTPDTEKIMDAARIARMKPEAYLINVSRGALVDEAALARALGQKKIAGAALDVFAEEPLRPESPLWDLENLLITPHTAAITDKLWDRHYDLIHKNLRRYLAGEPLLAEVDKKRGY
jgi:phosphoglycerate dehydrogenase-like enzyme